MTTSDPTQTPAVSAAGPERPVIGRPGPAEDGRKAILDAAAAAFVRRGYLATSIDAIADELGSTKGRVYHYYRGKAEIFLDVVVSGMHDLIREVEPLSVAPDLGPEERIRSMVHLHATLMMLRNHAQRVSVQAVEMRTVPEIAMHQDLLKQVFDLRRRYEQIFIDVIEEGMAHGVFVRADSHLVVKAALGSLNWIPIWYTPGRDSDEEVSRTADSFADFILNALKGGLPR
jgi:AcrR family transcriptional regulator